MFFSLQSLEERLHFVHDGLELLDLLTISPVEPSLILLDLNMPRLNGFETLQVLRPNKRFQQTPIVLLTTSDWLDDRRYTLALGATEFITKPLQLG